MTILRYRTLTSALVHLDLDVLDESYGKVGDHLYPFPGEMSSGSPISPYFPMQTIV